MPLRYGKLPSEESVRLNAIFEAMEKVTFSKNTAIALLGRRRLEELVERGEIDKTEMSEHQHGKWLCNAADVLRFIEPKF